MRDKEIAGLAMVLGKDCNMKITVTGDNSYCDLNGSHINIARMPATPTGVMLATGLVFHEIGHKNHTVARQMPPGLLGNLFNVVEDVRTEMETIKDRPGCRFNLNAVTKHYTDKGSLKPKTINEAILGKAMGRGRSRVLKQACAEETEKQSDEILDDAFGQILIDEAEKILDAMDTMKDTKDAMNIAEALMDLVLNPPPPPPPQGNGVGQGSGQGTGQGAGQGTIQGKAPGSKSKGGSKGNGAGGVGTGQLDPNASTTFGDISKLIQKEMDLMASKNKTTVAMLPTVGKRNSKGVFDTIQAISASSRMRAKIIGLLAASKRKPIAFGLSGKKISSSKLVKIFMGDPKMFKKKQDTPACNTAIVGIIDFSGSMGNQDRQIIASRASYALHHTLYGLPGVVACSLGFSANNVDVFMLTDFNQKPLPEHFNIPATGGTPTAEAIWAARAMLLNRKEPRKLLLILTDGQPDEGTTTREATKFSEADGIEIAAIGIASDSVKHYWKNYKVVSNIPELPQAVFGVMGEMLLSKSRQ